MKTFDKVMITLLVIIFGTIYTFAFVSAVDYGYNNLGVPQLQPDLVTFDNDTAYVNASKHWITNEGVLDNVADIKHNWLSNLLWSVAGHIMDTPLDMNYQGIGNIDDLNGSGTLNWTGDTWLEGNVFIKDSEDQRHHLNFDLEELDQLMANVFLTPLDITTFSNSTGDYVNLSALTESRIIVNLGTGTNAQNYRMDYNNYTLPLTAGTNETPVLNRVYVRLIGGVPTWEVSITKPTFQHAMASRINLGQTKLNPYGASLQEDGSNGNLKRIQRAFRLKGITYLDGFDYDATADSLNISDGTYLNGIYDNSFIGTVNLTQGFYHIHSDGDYDWHYAYSQIDDYSDGNPIGTNKYFNVILGITPYDSSGNIYAVIQNEPNVEYTSVNLAWADTDNTMNVYPSEDFNKIIFIPIARVIIKKGDSAQVLPNLLYAEDYRGGVAGGVSSGGGLSEVDPVWTVDKPDYWRSDGTSTATENWDLAAKNITNITRLCLGENGCSDSYTEWDEANGNLNLYSSDDLKFTASQVIQFVAGYWFELKGDDFYYRNKANQVGVGYHIKDAYDQALFSLNSFVGNHIIFTNYDWRSRDHDHPTNDNVWIYVHADTDPDIDNTQWLGLSHNKINGIIDVGTGGIQMGINDDVKTLFGVNSGKSIKANSSGMYFGTEVGVTSWYFDNDIIVENGVFGNHISTPEIYTDIIYIDATIDNTLSSDGEDNIVFRNYNLEKNISFIVQRGIADAVKLLELSGLEYTAYVNGNLDVSENVTFSQLINLNIMTLPPCSASTNGSIGRNSSGVYGCNNSGSWVKLY